MSNIRKDSKVTARTGNNVVVLGTVISVKGPHLIVVTSKGTEHDVLKETATKVSAADFKVMVAEESQPKVAYKVNETKVTNKKAAARSIFIANVGKKRKEIIAAFVAGTGMSTNCGSTYYQNFNSGKWAV